MKPPIRFTIPLAVLSFLSLACGFAQAATTPEPHHLQPNAPRSVTVSEAQTPPVIRAGLLQSTLILLPAEEKIATVFGGDTVDWVFDAGHVASRFISVKPNWQTRRLTSILSPITETSTHCSCRRSPTTPTFTSIPKSSSSLAIKLPRRS
jgi:hypothetical protein